MLQLKFATYMVFTSSYDRMKVEGKPLVFCIIMMKNLIIKFLVFILFASVFTSCLKQNNPLGPDESLKNISISRPFDGETFQFGDTLEIEAALNNNAVVDNIQLYVNGILVETQIRSPFRWEFFQGIAYRPGISIIKVVANVAFTGSFADSVSVLIDSDDIPYYDARVLQIYDHDPESFTQGLIFEDGFFFESAGLYGGSSLRKTTVETGEVLQIRYLDAAYFAEGLTVWQNSLIQLTWREQTGFVYDKANFDSLKSFSYETEGWGLTHDGSRLIMSDGTSNLYYLDPNSFQHLSSFSVNANGQPVLYLNELEYIYEDVFANIWRTPYIARIDPKKAEVIAWIDLEHISQENTRGVLNGIAFDPALDRLFVTGKRWSRMYEINLVPRKQIKKSARPIYAHD